MKTKKFLAMLLALAMVISTASVGALAADEDIATAVPTYSDTADNWAKDAIERWSVVGIVKGDGNGNFNPNQAMSRGELAQMLVNMFGLTVKAENTFTDLTGDEWYADAILKCAAAGIMKGDGSRCNAETKISRQETMVMFGRAVGVTPDPKADMSEFTDGASVADWAAGYMAALAKMGIVTGGGDGNVTPTADIDRASTMALLSKAVSDYVNAPGEYKVDNAKGFVVVNVAAKEGEVVLSGKTAGVVVSAGTAEGKIVAKDLTADTIKVDGAAPVSVEGKSTVGEVTANATGAITVAKGVTVDTVTANAAGTITNNGTIKELTANAATKVDNKGTITKADVKADGVVLGGTKPKDIVVEEGTKNPTDSTGKDIPATPDKPTGGNGGGGYVDPYTHVKNEAELTAALEGTATQIKLDADITLTEQILITRALTLDGGDKLITVPNDWASPIPAENCGILVMSNNVTLQNIKVSGPNKGGSVWDEGQYGIQVFNATGVTLNNVAVTKANAGILINSATVTMTGKIDVSGNEFGGIEVAMGNNVGGTIPLKAPSLDITNAVIVNNPEAATTPTIWIDGELANTTVVGNEKLIAMKNPAESKNQTFFFLNAVNEATLKTALAGEASTVNISGTIGNTSDYGVYTVDRAVTIKGGTVYGSFVVTAGGVTFDTVSITNKYDTSAPNGIGKNAINAYTDTLTVKDCTFTAATSETPYEPNGVSIFPVTNGTYTITNNTFNGYNISNPKDANAEWYCSAAISVAENYPMDHKTFFGAEAGAKSGTVAGATAITDNYFTDCAYGYAYMAYNEALAQSVKAAIVCNADALANATQFAAENATIELGGDIALTADETTVASGVAVTLDLNGKTITATGKRGVTNRGTLTINDSVGTGKFILDNTSGFQTLCNRAGTLNINGGAYESNGSNGVLYIGGLDEADNGGTVNISGDTTTFVSTKNNTINTLHDNTLNITGGTITAKGADNYAISSSHATSRGVNVINISGGKLISEESVAIYHPQNGTLDISGTAQIMGTTALEVKVGTVCITGGTFNATAEETSDNPNSNGVSTSGYAVALVEQADYTSNADVTVSISGGNFTGAVAKVIVSEREGQESLTVTGGIFSAKVASEYLGAGYSCTSSGTSWTVAEEQVSP